MYEPVRPVIAARRISPCELCGHRILPGEHITSVEGAWVHLDCWDGFDDYPEGQVAA